MLKTKVEELSKEYKQKSMEVKGFMLVANIFLMICCALGISFAMEHKELHNAQIDLTEIYPFWFQKSVEDFDLMRTWAIIITCSIALAFAVISTICLFFNKFSLTTMIIFALFAVFACGFEYMSIGSNIEPMFTGQIQQIKDNVKGTLIENSVLLSVNNIVTEIHNTLNAMKILIVANVLGTLAFIVQIVTIIARKKLKPLQREFATATKYSKELEALKHNN